MDGTRYVVELELRSVGDYIAQQALNKTAGKTKVVDDAITRLRGNIKDWVSESGSGVERIGRAFDWTARKAMGIAKVAIAASAAAIFAGATYGVVGLNAELEKAQVSLGTIFSAQGMARDVPHGIEKARGVIADMRKDAQKLPGEFSDLMQIYTAGAIPAFQAGLDENSWRELASKVMAAGVVGKMPLDQVAREMTQLLQGRSGAHNIFGMKLMGLSGTEAEKFNKLDAGKRVELLSKELNKYAGAIDSFSSTYEAASSTLVDNLKTFGVNATQPLFKRAVGALNEVNQWFDHNQARVGVWADRVGTALVHAWDEGRHALEEWGPLVVDFGERLYDRAVGIWKEIGPEVTSFGKMLKEALKDPGTIDKLMALGKLYLEAKGAAAVGGFALGSVHDIAQTAFYLKESYNIVKAIRAAGGISAAFGLLSGGASAAAAAGGTAAAGGAAVAGGEVAVGAAAGAAATGLGTLAGTLALAAFDIGIWWYDIKEGSKAIRQWNADAEADANARGEFAMRTLEAQHQIREGSYAYLTHLAEERRLRGDGNLLLQENIPLTQQYNQDLDHLIELTSELTSAHEEAAAAAMEFAYAASNFGAAFEVHDKFRQDQMDEAAAEPMRAVNSAAVYNLIHGKLNNEQINKLNEKKNRPAIKHGGHGTMKVEITITSNKDPSRIAREVSERFLKMQRLPTRSPTVQDFTKPKT